MKKQAKILYRIPTKTPVDESKTDPLARQLSTLSELRELADYVDELKEENASLKRQIAMLNRYSRSDCIYKETVLEMRKMAAEVGLEKKPVTILRVPLFHDVSGDKLWFEHVCDSEADANAKKQQVIHKLDRFGK